MIKINGEPIECAQLKLSVYLEEHGYLPQRIAVECNEQIVPKSQYQELVLHAGDVVEIVSLVGGG